MSGRPKIKVYQYDFNGKFLKTYESISEIREKYFSHVKGKLAVFGEGKYEKDYKILDDSTVITKNRIGRDAIKLILKKENSKYINKRVVKKQEIDCFNLNGELLATFTSISAGTALTGISQSTIFNQLNYPNKHYQNKELTFKHKEKSQAEDKDTEIYLLEEENDLLEQDITDLRKGRDELLETIRVDNLFLDKWIRLLEASDCLEEVVIEVKDTLAQNEHLLTNQE